MAATTLCFPRQREATAIIYSMSTSVIVTAVNIINKWLILAEDKKSAINFNKKKFKNFNETQKQNRKQSSNGWDLRHVRNAEIQLHQLHGLWPVNLGYYSTVLLHL